NSAEEGGPSENKRCSITSTQLEEMVSEEEMSRDSVSTPIMSCRRGMLNLDLSLLPSTHSFQAFSPLNWGGPSPSFRQVRSFNKQQEQEHGQLTIFYGGAVNVYNVSADKAKAIMMMASKSATPTPLSDMQTFYKNTPLKA
ncbi:hypothetical protein KI387_031846, partial [Taxus chinensis]